MRAVSLFLVFVLAKVAVLWGHSVPLSLWSPAAYFWQDALVALAFAGLELVLPKRAALSLYWALAIYAAVNIPIARAVSTPLTWPMLRAARGPLADSFLLYVTWQNIALIALILGLSIVGRRHALPSGMAAHGAALLIVLGPIASARVETLGLHRNPLVALITTALPRAQSSPNARTSPFPQDPPEDLSSLRGIAKGRNVVMVSLESTAAEYLSLYGAGQEVTPNLTALARDAVIFDNAYSVYPESIKGLFSVLCSAYPAMNSKPEDYQNAPCQSVAAELAASGYRTALFHSGRFGYLGMESIIRHRGYQTLEDAGDIGGNHQSSFGVDEPATVARMLAWIDALPHGERFFMTYLPIAGHHPYETPHRGPFAERDEIGRYRNALRYGDESLGALMEGLRARGLAESTLWLVYGDHGEAFGQHEGNFAHTFFLYEENVHVPFIIAAPGLIHGQKRVRRAVSLVDTAPTLLDLAGIAVPGGYQGKSMLDAVPRMARFFTDYSLHLSGLRDGHWKLIYDLDSGRAKLFDLDRDPHEMTDVSDKNRGRFEWYVHLLTG